MVNNLFTGFVDFTTRRKRQEILSIAFQLLEQILQAEIEYMERVPEYFLSGEAFETTDAYICMLSDALLTLTSVYK